MKRVRFVMVVAFAIMSALGMVTPTYAAAAVSGTTLTLSFPPGIQNVKLEMGPTDGEVRVFGVPGVADGATYTGITAVVYSGGAGDDTIQIEQKGVRPPSVRVDTRAGNNTIKLDVDIFAGGAGLSDVTIITGAGEAKLEALLESDAPSLDVRWRFDTLGGRSEVKAAVLADDPSTALNANIAIRGSSASDTVETAIKSAASKLDVVLGIQTANAEDQVKAVIEQLRPITANVRFNIDTDGVSLTNDTLDVLWAGPGSTLNATGTIRTGGYQDLLKVEFGSNVTNSFTVDGGDGNDLVDVLVKGTYTGSARVAGGAGDDDVTFRAEAGVFGSPRIDGGAGFDRCWGAGIVSGCEEANGQPLP
jgi:hypothetical protein